MRKKFPDVVSQEELNDFFDVKTNKEEVETNGLEDKTEEPSHCIDLYRLIDRDTDWPLKSYSLKTIAQSIGFKWRDPHPSGAASIQWYNKWTVTKDPKDLQRILEYNEDDCIASMWVKDYLEKEMQKFVENLEKQVEKKDDGDRPGYISLPIIQ